MLGRMTTIASRATPDGTARFHARHAAVDHVRSFAELALSSVGIGTYLGAADDATDARYAAAIGRAIDLGINVVDTASNYRGGRSERAVGRALAGRAGDEVVGASQGGFLTGPGVAPAGEIVAGCHRLAARSRPRPNARRLAAAHPAAN